MFTPFNIDAKVNSAYVTIGLLYGKKDFFQTIDIASRCGQDADCNASTAAGVLGTMIGYSNIPEIWRESLYEVVNRPFAYTDVSLNKLCDLSLKHALKIIEQVLGSNHTIYLKKHPCMQKDGLLPHKGFHARFQGCWNIQSLYPKLLPQSMHYNQHPVHNAKQYQLSEKNPFFHIVNQSLHRRY